MECPSTTSIFGINKGRRREILLCHVHATFSLFYVLRSVFFTYTLCLQGAATVAHDVFIKSHYNLWCPIFYTARWI
jgi:hypothetical protein